MGLVAKGWSALEEVDRVIDHADLNDPRLIPLLRVRIMLFFQMLIEVYLGQMMELQREFCVFPDYLLGLAV